MAQMIKLPERKQQMVEVALTKLLEKTNMEVYRSMKKKLIMTFGEENVQIAKIDEEVVHRRLRDMGYNDVNVHSIDDVRFQGSVNQVTSVYHIIIRVPEFVIKNSRGNSTTIRDMFVRLQVLPDGRIAYTGLEGMVTTFTKAQARMGYMHSHLVPTHQGLHSIPSFGGFCTGQGPIGQVLALLQNKYDDVNFQMLCLHIKNFLEWESLEGTPHCRMGDINETMTSAPAAIYVLPASTVSTISEMMRKAFYQLDPEQSRKMVSISSDEYEIHVEPTEELEKWVGDMIVAKSTDLIRLSIGPDTLLVVKDKAGNYFRYVNHGGNINVTKQTVLNFRGEDIKIKIVDNEENLKSTKYGNPKIIEQLCFRIAADLTRTALDYAPAGDNNSSENKRETTDANNDPVRQTAQS